MQRGQNGGIHLLADADHRDVAVLDSRRFQRLFVQTLYNIRVFCQLPHLSDLILAAVQNDQLRAGFRQIPCQRLTEAAKPDNAIRYFTVAFLVKHVFSSVTQSRDFLPDS